MTKNINIHPRDCGPNLRGPIQNILHREVQGTMGVNGCHIVAVTEIIKIGKGKIQDETGYAIFHVRYKAIVFRPIRNEVVDAIVGGVDQVRSVFFISLSF